MADIDNQAIRKISPMGVVTTLAGNGSAGYADGSGAAAKFNTASGIAVDSAGNVYVADTMNNAIRKISPTGSVTTLVGTPYSGIVDENGARYLQPSGVAVDRFGVVYVSSVHDKAILKIVP